MTTSNAETSDERFASASAYIAGEVAAGRAYCLGFDVGSRSCVGVLDGFGTLSFLADRPDGGVTFGHALKLPFVRGDADAGARTIRDGVERVLESGRDAIVPDTLRGLGLDDGTRLDGPLPAPWSDRLSDLVGRIDWDVIRRTDGARIDGRLYRALLLDSPAWERGMPLRAWAVASVPGMDLDCLDVGLPIAENILRIAEASREASLPVRDRAWLRNALDGLEGLSVPPEGVPGGLAWLTANPARSMVPTTPSQWQAFLGIHALRRMFEHRTRLSLPKLSEARGGDYAGLLDRVARGLGGQDGPADLWRVFEVVSSPVTQFVEHVVHPMGARLGAGLELAHGNKNAEAFAYGLMVGDKGLGGLRDLSDAFHAGYANVARALGKAVEGQGLSWNAAFPGVLDLGAGWTAQCLTTPEELAAEGDGETGLDHCVAGYFRSCIQVGLVIVSVRRHGIRTETMAFGFSGVWRLREHFGRSNTRPGDGYQARFTAVAKALVRHQPKGMLVKSQATPLESGEYDPMRPGAIEAVAEAFLPLMPRHVRADGVGGLFDRLRAALPGMTPLGPPQIRLCRL